MSDENLVSARTYSCEFDAEIARLALEANDIECAVAKDDCGGLQPRMLFDSGVRVLVREPDLDRALEVLREID